MKKNPDIESLIIQAPREAIELIYATYGESLYGILFRILGDEARAQDALQDGLVKCFKKLHTFDAAKGSVFTWCLNICRNTALDELRRIERQHKGEIRLKAAGVYKESVHLPVDALDLPEHISRLAPKYREVIQKLYYQGFTQQEASEALNVPLGTLKTRTRIALRELRKIFAPELLFILLAIRIA